MTPMDDSDDRDLELDALLRATDPWPASRPVDPALAANALALVRKEIEMSDTPVPVPSSARRRRRPLLALAAVLVAVALLGGLVALRSAGGGADVSSAPGRALGDAFASCIAFSETELAKAPIAFDGTVSAIAADGTISFTVERWYRGGEGETTTARASTLIEGAPELNGGVGFVEGRRYLVSGERQDGVLVPAICGFSVEHDDAMAQRWASAFSA
jgi:hypothetical protein